MNRELCAEQQRLQHARDRTALLALSLWGGGCYLLYLGWRATAALPDRFGDIAVIGIYLVTFFHVFAFWPILIAVEKLFRGPAQGHGGQLQQDHGHVIHDHGPAPEHRAQEGGKEILAASSSIASSRDPVGGASSSDTGR
jgi:hypothetical protein